MEERDTRRDTDAPKPSSNDTKKAEQRVRLQGSKGIGSLRDRLYERGVTPRARARHSLRTENHQLQPKLDIVPKDIEGQPPVQRVMQDIHAQGVGPERIADEDAPGVPRVRREEEQSSTVNMPKKHNRYRLKILLAGVAFFVVALGISSAFLFFGGNTISGENITIDLADPPLAVGGGQEMTLQVAISNLNTVPIESATLIIDYPPGTQSATEKGKELYTERQQLNNIGAGELVNVPIKAIFFGEENEEKTVNVSIEYRVKGSNATFFKEAAPWNFKITSSPVVVSVDNVKSISSGQEATFNLTVSSNSPTPLTDVLVKAAYPSQFDFTSAEPATVSGQDTWLIPELKPQEQQTIVIKGIVGGKQNEDRVFTFSVGVANERDRFNLASVYTKATSDIAIEAPFLGVGVTVNGDTSDPVTIGVGDPTSVRISFNNTLEDTIYDGKVIATLSGNALNEFDVTVEHGFYDSTKNTITWDPVDVDSLKEIGPGKGSEVGFSLVPKKDVGETPEIRLDITAKGQRVFEDKVPQELVGTASRVIRIASTIALSSSALYSEGPFINSGPTPPVAEKVTQYTYLLTAKNGSNDITGAVMTAHVPQYVTWLDLVTPGDDVTYNSTTRTMTWDIGNMKANEYKEAWVQVSFLPSLTQVNTTPTLLETQDFKATDRFTGTVVRAQAPPLTTALINDPDQSKHEGRVVAQ